MTKKNILTVLLKMMPYIIVLIIGLLWFLRYDSNAKKAIEETKANFPLLTRDEPLTGKVMEIYCPREIRCSTPPILVILKRGQKKSINSDESIDRTTSLIKFISVGDSLAKKSNNDTLYVYKKEKVRSFLIR
jgi:hypothetical protein